MKKIIIVPAILLLTTASFGQTPQKSSDSAQFISGKQGGTSTGKDFNAYYSTRPQRQSAQMMPAKDTVTKTSRTKK